MVFNDYFNYFNYNRNVMQRRKTSCVYHPNQFITNFCRDKSCLMPLCPSCIGDHTKYHQQNHTKPIYHNIHQSLLQTQDLLYKSIYHLEQDKKRNHKVMNKVNSFDQLITQRLMQAKNIIYTMIDDAFFELQSSIRLNLNKLHEEIGLYSMRKMQKMEQSITLILDELYYINQGLKNQKYLGNMIIFLKDKLHQSTTIHQKSKAQIDQNQNYQPRIQLNNQAKTTILFNLKKIIKIDDKKQLDKRKQKHKQQKSIHRQRSQLKDENTLKIQKIQRSYTPTKLAQIYNNPSKSLHQDLSQSKKVLLHTNNQIYSPYRQKSSLNHQYHMSQMQMPSDIYFNNKDTNRIRDFKQEFQMLSQKVSMMRKENQIIAKTLR